MRNSLAKANERAVVVGKTGSVHKICDRDLCQSWEDVSPKNRGIRKIPAPGAHSMLVRGVLAPAHLGSAPSVSRVPLFEPKPRQNLGS
jgi:hypothetical protein